MAFPIRSLDEISRRIRGAIRQYLPGTDASLKQNVLTVIGKVVALFAHEYELRLQWIFRQLFLRTATSLPIVRMHAADYGIFQKPASPAAGEISGTGAANETYPAGVRYVSGGVTYVTTEPFTADAIGDFVAKVVAETAGAATNRDAGAELLLADPGLFPVLSDQVTVGGGGLGGGADTETIESLRSRALKRKAAPAQGGALADYENWSLEVPGVANCWAALFSNGVGTIGVWALFLGRANGIPTESDLKAIDDHIRGKRLVRGRFYAVAPLPKPVDITVRLSPDSIANRTAVTRALQSFFDATEREVRITERQARIRPGLPDDPFVLPRAWVSEVISGTDGEISHTLTEPSGDLTFQPGELPVLGAIDWA